MRVILAGGGTGGHIFPALALAQEFVDREGRDAVLFVGSKRGLDSRIISRYGFTLKVMNLEGFRGRSLIKKFLSLSKVIRGLFASFSIIRDFKPNLVIGAGGYSSGPVVVVASLLRIKTAILEQNLLPGLTNRILSHFVNRIFTSFEDSSSFFPDEKTLFTGNPVRKDIFLRYPIERGHQLGDWKRGESKFTILILGGSQGAHQINLVMIKVLGYLSDIKEQIEIIHQSGKGDHELLKNVYHEKGFSCRIVDFIDDMSEVYKKSHLVICRGGATTLSELLVCGKASIIVPFPHATDSHQDLNARALKDRGAAWVMDTNNLSGKDLALAIRSLYEDSEKREEMERKALEMGKPGATRVIVENCYRLVEEGLPREEGVRFVQ